MQTLELGLSGVFEFRPAVHADARGHFAEWFRSDLFLAATGRSFDTVQVNVSTSHSGVVRGIHFSDVPLGQAKYVSAIVGTVRDYIVDVRVGSPTFAQWVSVVLSDETRNSVFIPEGFGHAFAVLSPFATITYLVTDLYRPVRERTISIYDRDIALKLSGDDLMLSPQDDAAPTLAELAAAGALPEWAACLEVYERASGARIEAAT